MTTKILVSHVSWSMLSHLFSRGSMMLSAVLLARFLTEHDFATYSYFQMTATMIATYSAMGLGVTASKFFAELDHKTNSKNTDVIKSIGTLWTLSIGLAFAAAFIVFLIPTASLTSGLNIPVWLFALCVWVMALDIVPSGGILGLERYKQVACISLLSGSINLAGAYISTQTYLPIYSMWALVMGCATQAFGEMYVIARNVGWPVFFRLFVFDRSKLKVVFSFVGPMFLVSIMAGSGTWILGKIILSGPDGQHEFALYSIGLQWYSLALFIPLMISRVMLPRIIKNTSSDSKSLVRQSVLFSLLSAFFLVLIGYVFGEELMSLYGIKYEVGNLFLTFFLLAALFNAPANALGNTLIGRNNQKIWMEIILVWFLVLMVSGFLFSEYGAWLGAMSLSVSAAFLVTMAFFVCKNKKYI
jgi:O-antigen/teichoic acid export membrane protein